MNLIPKHVIPYQNEKQHEDNSICQFSHLYKTLPIHFMYKWSYLRNMWSRGTQRTVRKDIQTLICID